MDKEPLLPANTPKSQSLLCTLPENDEISIPLSLTPSELKDMLIFGSPREPIVDALALSLNNNSNSNSIINPNGGCDPEQVAWLLDPNYSIGKTNLHRSKTAPAMAAINDFEHPSEAKPPQSSSSSIVRQAVLLLILYLSLGVVIYWYNREHFVASETHVVVDALYFCIVTMCTIGGMVSYVLDLQESHLLRSLKNNGNDEDHPSYIIDVKKGRMRIRMKVALALGVVILCIGVGVGVMHYVERLNWLDSFYLSVMSVTTVGYGDRAFRSMAGRIFASVWLLVSTLAVARAFLYLAEARVDKRHRRMAKWVLNQGLTVSQFIAADIDNNGYVSKSEFVIYKLKEMGKISEKDILQICKIFDRLNTGNCGKITLADLMQSHHS
ncbi:hypothetical protein E3N88_33341 [Mikania micrantha]|uniref:Potassium channel domain-containing protein n=1 Tax=Mikania micrantha TaxID=192012 RepID=A0A5N6MB75_9ASTR|nr:hypothetical protein E3N88_33341 [Mikania micrantha]